MRPKGPIGKGLSALLLGRSSATLQGVIDADFTGQIYAMLSTPSPPVTIPEKTRIAQLILFKSCVPCADSREQGDQSFGSTGQPKAFWTKIISKDRPIIKATVIMPKAKPSQIEINGLSDTGSDVIIISAYEWPLSWPTTLSQTTITGIGGITQSYLSDNPTLIKNDEGQTATVWTYVTAEEVSV